MVGYAVSHSPRSPLVTLYIAEPAIEGSLVPGDGGLCLTPAAIIPAVGTGQYPSPTATNFCKDSHNQKLILGPYCYYNITYDITINLLDEEAKEPPVQQTTHRNSRRNAEGVWEDGRNEIKTIINPSENTQQYTHPGGGGGWG